MWFSYIDNYFYNYSFDLVWRCRKNVYIFEKMKWNVYGKRKFTVFICVLKCLSILHYVCALWNVWSRADSGHFKVIIHFTWTVSRKRFSYMCVTLIASFLTITQYLIRNFMCTTTAITHICATIARQLYQDSSRDSEHPKRIERDWVKRKCRHAS